jgi:hypothetical protein
MKAHEFFLAIMASSIASIAVSELKKIEYPWKDFPLLYPEG